MPRKRIKPVTMLAASPAIIADALGIRSEVVALAVKQGELLCYAVGPRRRILVRDALRWFKRKYPPTLSRRNSHV